MDVSIPIHHFNLFILIRSYYYQYAMFVAIHITSMHGAVQGWGALHFTKEQILW